jgi:hypothetical protein
MVVVVSVTNDRTNSSRKQDYDRFIWALEVLLFSDHNVHNFSYHVVLGWSRVVYVDLYASDADMGRMVLLGGHGGVPYNYSQQMYVS